LILDTSKAEKIKKQFENKKKLVIFYKFIAERKMLEEVFDGEHTSCPDEFRDTDKRVFLAQYVSGREGINLSSADDIVFYNLDFSAVSYFQARERVSTKQKDNATYLWWIFSNSGFERKVHTALSSKKDFTVKYYTKDIE
jgi:ERCC4-related helicase